MMPWDMMVTVNGYWYYKFRNTSLDGMTFAPLNSSTPGLTRRQKEFESYISIASSVPSSITVIAHALFGNRFSIHGRAMVIEILEEIRNTGKLGISKVSLVGMITTFTGIIVLAYLDSDDWATLFLIFNLTFAVIINIFRALFRATNRFAYSTAEPFLHLTSFRASLFTVPTWVVFPSLTWVPFRAAFAWAA